MGIKRLATPAVSPSQIDGLIVIGLVVATLAVYGQVATHQFIGFDDYTYVKENPMVSRGLTIEGIAWAFTTFYAANWHPLTWLSHMLDCQLFGLNAGGHLLINTLLHATNSSLVFLFLKRATGTRWQSAMVAALFALHPMHVESVAWVAERKDMLSAFFGLLCLIAYVRYCEQGNRRRYVWVISTLALGLMCKPMLVTWPFVLLLLDYWPLRRLKRGSAGDVGKLLREKAPLFALTTASIVITYVAQSSGGAVRALGIVPMAARLSNALVSYVRYLCLTFYPNDLAVFYPFNVAGIAGWQVIGALILLVGITVIAWRAADSWPYFLVGWLWFLGTLVPVIGIVQVGDQIMADRYYYIPSIGLFTALVFGAAEIMRVGRLNPSLQGAIASAPLLAMLPLTVLQVSRWRDSETLYAHTLRVTPPNWVIEYDFGLVFAHRGDYEKAAAHFERALAIKPNSVSSLVNMGIARSQQHRLPEALTFLQRAVAVEPSSSTVHTQLGLVYANLRENEKAAAELQRGVELAPLDAEARANLGLVLLRLRRVTEAGTQLREALRLNPNQADAHNNLGLILLASGKAEESLTHFSTALRLKPDMAVAQENIKRAEAQINARKK